VFAVVALAPLAAPAAEPQLCAAPPGWTAIMAPLERTALRVAGNQTLTIVAVGSSSTAGTGATRPDLSYPSRLAVELRRRAPRLDVRVVNRGVGGQDVPEELARLASDVVALHPDLVIWQLGTNAVLRRDDLAADGERVRQGIELLKQAGVDVVLMDLQYAPRVLDRPSYAVMEDLIAEAASQARVGLFRRFALMEYWQRTHPPHAAPMVGADGLHMTDAGYGCLAIDLAAALEANWRAEQKFGQRTHGRVDAVAGLPVVPAGDLDGSLPVPAVRRNDAKPIN
jgi:lysophospholipase L1-like esterase